jgi:hypothetical protein
MWYEDDVGLAVGARVEASIDNASTVLDTLAIAGLAAAGARV